MSITHPTHGKVVSNHPMYRRNDPPSKERPSWGFVHAVSKRGRLPAPARRPLQRQSICRSAFHHPRRAQSIPAAPLPSNFPCHTRGPYPNSCSLLCSGANDSEERFSLTSSLFFTHPLRTVLSKEMLLFYISSREWRDCALGLKLKKEKIRKKERKKQSPLICWRVAAFSNDQIVHGLLPPLPSHPDSLECWYLGYGGSMMHGEKSDVCGT